MCTPDGTGCALAAPGAGFGSVADALRAADSARAIRGYREYPALARATSRDL
jgi:hypothetical protein